MFTQLFTFLSGISPSSPELTAALNLVLHKEGLPKKTILLKEGKMCDKVYFIEQGLVRAFYCKDGQEITSWFMKENDFIISVYSFFTRKASYETIELLEDTTLISIRYQDLQQLYHQFPEFNYVGRVLTEHYYIKTEEQAISLRMHSTQERYQHLLHTFPQIFQRASLKHIASYLGMTPETLSRLRAKIR